MGELQGNAAYNRAVSERFRRPAVTAGKAISGQAGSMSAGAVVCFSADLEAGRLSNMGFRAWACPHIIAACSLIADHLEGAAVQQMAGLATDGLLRELEIPVEKAGKILILKDALRACYEDFEAHWGAGKSSTELDTESK